MELEERIKKIEDRNDKVQAEKAWETSKFRVLSITLITYITVSITLFFIDNDKPFINALIPTLGYFLSTQSLTFIKKWWIAKFFNNNK